MRALKLRAPSIYIALLSAVAVGAFRAPLPSRRSSSARFAGEDKRRQRFYYFNVRTKAVSWKPPAVMSVETAMQVIRTPRSFATHALERQRRMEEEEEAAATAETDEDEDESEDEDEHGGGGEIVERAAPRDP